MGRGWRKLMALAEECKDLIFPKMCVGCDEVEETWLCDACKNGLKILESTHCLWCAKKTDRVNICQSCQSESGLNDLWVAYNYADSLVAKIIEAVKYHYQSELIDGLTERLGELMKQRLVLLNVGEASLLPVPLHRRRERERGFNQARLIAQRLQEKTGLEVIDRSLKRARPTEQQARLNKEERQLNVKDAFMVAGDTLPQTVILIDDVASTGSTLKECAKVLRLNGVSRVYGAVLAMRK